MLVGVVVFVYYRLWADGGQTGDAIVSIGLFLLCFGPLLLLFFLIDVLIFVLFMEKKRKENL